MTRAKDISKILTDADISGDIDVDGVTNLDVVDIDGAVDMASTALVTGVLTANGGAVFNEAGADVDFRVESDTVTHALFVQGSDGAVGIGTDSPSSTSKLHIAGAMPALTGGFGQLQVFSTNALGADVGGKISLGGVSGSADIYDPYGFSYVAGLKENATSSNFAGYLGFGTSNSGGSVAERMRIDSSGNLTLKNTNNIANITTAAITLTGAGGGGTGGQTVNIATTSYVGVLAIGTTQNVSCLYYINGAGATQVVVQNAVDARFSKTSGSGNTANIYVSGANIVMQNNIQATRSFYITFMGKF
jgi:hypothetical protein